MKVLKLILPFLSGILLLSCKIVGYFNTPNDVLKKESTIYLQNGDQKKGLITVQFETGHDAKNTISLQEGEIELDIPLDSIRYYKVNEEVYVPKLIDVDLDDNNKLLFVKRLTNETSKIHLYELFIQRKNTNDGMERYYYFIQLPHFDRFETLNIAHRKLVPNFEEKMSKLVEDCPSLSGKIKQKQEGYFLRQLTLSNVKKIDVLTKIINDYNNCK
jgi:hypothetical protein